MLDDRHRDADDVGFLERVGADDATRHLAGDDDERHGVHVGRGDTRNRIRGSGARRDDDNAGATRRARIAVRLMHRSLLVASEDMRNLLAVVQRVVDFDGLTAGVTEHQIDALGLERGDNGLGAVHAPALLLGLAAQAQRPANLRFLAFHGVAHETYAPLSADETSFCVLGENAMVVLRCGCDERGAAAGKLSSSTWRLISPPSMSTVIWSPSSISAMGPPDAASG